VSCIIMTKLLLRLAMEWRGTRQYFVRGNVRGGYTGNVQG